MKVLLETECVIGDGVSIYYSARKRIGCNKFIPYEVEVENLYLIYSKSLFYYYKNTFAIALFFS